jgi:CubicO group peptidase (beta-lactamase class C family)/D-alanyl-D-alanine dipeptidase
LIGCPTVPRGLCALRILTSLIVLSIIVYPMPSEARRTEAVVSRPAIDTALWTSIDSAARSEAADKQIPSLVIAVVGGGGIIWSQAYGFEDADRRRPATIDSIYRMGSITEVLTDLLVMQLADAGELDVNRPIGSYLPGFKPVNPFGGTITMRMLLAHTSGLVQEPPIGSHFAGDQPSLDATVRSLNGTTLVAAPGTMTKHSNAGLAVAGRVLEVVSGQSYADLVSARLLQPLGMRMSALTHRVKTPVYAEMAPFDSTRFAAPLFDFGDAPAGGLYASARDMSQFARMLIGGGAVGNQRIIAAAVLADLKTQPTKNADSVLGLARGTVGDWQTLESAGGLYGFSSDLLVAADQGFAVVVLSALHDTPSARRLARFVMTALAAAQAARPIPVWPRSSAYDTQAGKLAGFFRHDEDSLVLRNVGGRLYLDAPTVAAEVRRTADGTALDDAGTFSSALQLSADFNRVVLSGNTYERAVAPEPAPPTAAVREILGDYGWPHDYIRIYERDGHAYARIDWSSYEPLTALGRDVWTFPRTDGPYRLESLRFERDAKGRINIANLSGMAFPRRDFGKEAEAALRKSMRPIASLRAEALASRPPVEPGPKRAVELVELTPQMPGIRLDVRYATSNDFLKTPVYTQARAFLQRPAADALRRVAASLASRGFGLTIHDGYRPWFVTKMFWDATPDDNHIFVANPREGSRHNRGAAVDLTLHDLKTGGIVEMPGGYDEMSSRSFPLYVGGTSLQRWRRDLLHDAMEAQGFTVYEAEWWHFDFNGWQDFPISNLEFSQIGQ